jgi:hypothetical protein
MATVIFFIYLHYLRATGYNTTVFDYVCLFILGSLQVASWFIKIGILSKAAEGKEVTSQRLDEWLK